MRRMKFGEDWKELIDEDVPPRVFDEAARQNCIKYGVPGDVRLSTGRVFTTEEGERVLRWGHLREKLEDRFCGSELGRKFYSCVDSLLRTFSPLYRRAFHHY